MLLYFLGFHAPKIRHDDDGNEPAIRRYPEEETICDSRIGYPS